MGDPLYLADPTTPDERDRVMRGIEKTLPAPAQAALYQLLPNANYVYDPGLRMWVPQQQAASTLVVLLQQIAQYAEDTAETSAQIRQEVLNTRLRMAQLAVQLPAFLPVLQQIGGTIDGLAETAEGSIASWLSQLKRQGSPNLLYGTTTPRVRTVTDGDDIRADGTRQGTTYVHDFGVIDANARRKYVAIDAGAYTPPAAGGTAITFTGVNLLNRVGKFVFNVTDWMRHEVVSIVDPAGGAVGTITVRPPVPSATATFIIPYTDTPHGWNSAADAYQTIAVVGDPPRINGPATFISVNAALAANFQYIIPCALYGRYQIEIVWYTAGTTQVQFNIFGKYNDAAWAALGAIPAGYSQNSKFQTVAGIAFGAPPVGGGAAATPNILCARMQEPDGFNSFAIEMNSINRDAVAVVVTGTYRLQGGTT